MRFSRQIFLLIALAPAALLLSHAQEPVGPLNGRVDNNQYLSPTGAYRVAIPVLAVLGGSITDTENVVTFQERFTTHQSIACFKLDAKQLFEDESRGRKEYLIWFLANFVQADFEQRFPGARVESAHFLPDLQGGALLAYNLLPGGSMFSRRILLAPGDAPPVAKRGNLLFVHEGHIYVLSIELAEKVIEGSAYTLTTEQEDAVLRKRLDSLLAKITFTTPATTAPSGPAATNPTDKPAGEGGSH